MCSCYSPHYADCDVTCSSGQGCPAGLQCDGMYCRDGTTTQTCDQVIGDARLGQDSNNTDGPRDVGTADDTDADGIPNSADNCPSNYNPDQNDEDNDTKGDPCDICPAFDMYFEPSTGTLVAP